LNLPPALIDGEIVALDSDGNPDFSLLQQRLDADDRGALDLFAFDLLELDGEDLTDIPNIAQGPACGVVARCHRCRARPCRRSLDRGGATLFGTICNMEQEGILSKRADAPYRAGRTHNWLKVKCVNRQEFVVIGWTRSTAAGRESATCCWRSTMRRTAWYMPARLEPASMRGIPIA
jgi:bifunctional non-homologous end joining protein LigD